MNKGLIKFTFKHINLPEDSPFANKQYNIRIRLGNTKGQIKAKGHNCDLKSDYCIFRDEGFKKLEVDVYGKDTSQIFAMCIIPLD
jgi:hypothetical protein